MLGGSGNSAGGGGGGGQGAAGMNGGSGFGGGGGASRIYDDTASAVVAVAAGGGGAGGDSEGGRGGPAAANGSDSFNPGGTEMGYAGTSSVGGAGGTVPGANGSSNVNGNPGSALTGGSATAVAVGGFARGGGGGGGVYGGGSAGTMSTYYSEGGGGGWSALPSGWTDATVATAPVLTAGYYTATFGLCPVPAAPTGVAISPNGSTATVSFTPGASTGMAVSGWEVSADGGNTWSALTTSGSSPVSGTITGLTAGSTYQVTVRPAYIVPTTAGTTANSTAGSTGQGAASAVQSITVTAGAPGAVTGVIATPGTSSVGVAWQAPSSGSAVDHYVVTSSAGAATCTTAATSCVLGAVAGTSPIVTVTAVDSAGRSGPGVSAQAGEVTPPPVPATVPSAPLTLTTDRGRITSVDTGQRITVIGTGFAPFSTATIVIYSTPTVLATVTTDANGNFSRAVSVPASLAAGLHSLVASGVDPSGQPHAMRMDVTVQAGENVSNRLASTGFSAGLPISIGLLGLTAGGFLLAVGRRRRV